MTSKPMTPERIAGLRQLNATMEGDELGECLDEIERLRSALEALITSVEIYIKNCDADHLDDCQFCRNYGSDACPNEKRDDFMNMDHAAVDARAALEAGK